ncbi:MAG TPA: hypothetical protein VLG47_01685 [Candidatus Saccharimonadales bacterium]|nr:hypothetical protein [Candidatus Saccharimonadales bacterium]
MKKSTFDRAVSVIASSKFFWVILGIFILESLWIVFTTIYPMAFDEDFHFGLIKIYSHHILPFLSHQPPDANFFGPVANNPSYFYHYLMSFPYRIIALFVHSQTLQVICLRLINVALFAYSLVLFRKVFLRAKLTPAFTNFALFLFVFVPIVPMLAAQINYDNLSMVLVAWICLLMIRILSALNKNKIPATDIVLLACIGLVGSIVKYAFLPIMAASVIAVAIFILHAFGNKFNKIGHATAESVRKLGRLKVVLLSLLLLVSLGLFSQRYLVNIATYKAAIPKCDKILTVDECMSYGPFNRTYTLLQTKDPNFKPSIVTYIPLWLYGMWFRTFFAVNGNIPSPWWARYETIPPLKLPSLAVVGLIISSFGVVVIYIKKLYRDKFLIFLAMMAVLYTAALFIENYGSYAHSGQPVAINGRYLLPMALPAFIIAGRAWQLALSGHSRKIKLLLAGIVAVLFIQGGGVLTFMINSNHTWYWPDHRTQAAGFYAHEITQKFVILDTPMYIMPP